MDRVCLHGFEPAPERLYPAFDAVALSSEREGLPNALLEAGAAGRAIVSTAAGGATRSSSTARPVSSCRSATPDAFARGLGRLVREPELRERLGAAVRLHVARTFGMDRFVAEFAACTRNASSAAGAAGPVGTSRSGT